MEIGLIIDWATGGPKGSEHVSHNCDSIDVRAAGCFDGDGACSFTRRGLVDDAGGKMVRVLVRRD